MNAHLYIELKIGQTDCCPCDTAPMASQHLLHNCPHHDIVRQETWPKDTSLRDKLFGDPLALRKTAAFVRMTGCLHLAFEEDSCILVRKKNKGEKKKTKSHSGPSAMKACRRAWSLRKAWRSGYIHSSCFPLSASSWERYTCMTPFSMRSAQFTPSGKSTLKGSPLVGGGWMGCSGKQGRRTMCGCLFAGPAWTGLVPCQGREVSVFHTCTYIAVDVTVLSLYKYMCV